MVKMIKLGKYLNSPPEKTIYYNTDDFNLFVRDYATTILVNYPIKNPPKLTLEYNKLIVEYPNRTYIYTKENKEAFI